MNGPWYARVENGRVIGPITEHLLRAMATAGRLQTRDEVSVDRLLWKRVREMTWLMDAVEESTILDSLMGMQPDAFEKSNSLYRPPVIAKDTENKSKVKKRTPQVDGPSERRSLIPASILHMISAYWTTSRAATVWSVLLHIAILCVLALIVLADRPVRDVLTISAEFSIEAPDLQTLDLVSTDIEVSSPPERIDSLLRAVDVTTVGRFGSTEAEFALPSFSNGTLPESGSRGSEKQKKNTARRGKGASATEGSGDGQGSGPGKASFFGTEVKARSIAFVIDASGSMTGARFHRARNELADSLRALKANQRFFVVFYTDQTYPQFYPNNLISLINADRTNISNILSWIERSQTQGGTEPQQAVAISLELKPDVMFFLSDGEIPPNTPDIVRQANRGTVIHTIAFGSDAGGQILKQIATDTGGTHRFIGDGF